MRVVLNSALLLAILLSGGLQGCRSGESRDESLFELLPAERTGIRFTNELAEDPAFNILNYLYYYDGGGVSIGDVNNDGLPDIYLTSNLYANRLFLNKGDFGFEDITERAGVAGSAGWAKASTMVDLNADGWLDIYVSAANHPPKTGKNELFINNGDLTFSEQAAAYGLDLATYASQASFFDYDLDGDLDMFLVNHSIHSQDTYGDISLREERDPLAGDRLLRNDSDAGMTRFTDVSEEAGIIGGAVGYGLSVSVSDLNLDGCPDIYVANDFHENDYLYFNNCDGTFRESIYTATGHTSRSSMGVDIADFNNDGMPDIAVVDMLPERGDILKTAVSADDYDVDRLKLNAGYHHQYARNTLQLNRGNERFSDIGYLAGVEATDWSWSVLFCDLDLDGFKDLFVTNGIYRRPNDQDYLRYARQPEVLDSLQKNITTELLNIIHRMPQVPLSNYAFRNGGNLSFTDESGAWGLDLPGFSNGAAYADLDNDGDLDLVINNIDAPASVYRNRTRELKGAHYLTVELEGLPPNLNGIGAKVIVWTQASAQLQEAMPTRGWSSSVETRLHFGLGDSPRIDSLVVVWPDLQYQTMKDVEADGRVVLSQGDATGRYRFSNPQPTLPFEGITDEPAIGYRHRENAFFDFTREPLAPHMLSREGPALAVGDVDGNGLDDVFLGGAKWQAAELWLQGADGAFERSNEALWHADSLCENVDAVFFDADRDADLDLYVVSAGNEFSGNSEALRDRLYRNDGLGRFVRDSEALPALYSNGSVVRPGDFDDDGDLDLFVGGRVVPRSYGVSPESFLLENNGLGVFRDVTAEIAPALLEAGMIADAVWADVDSDGRDELILAGEWTPIRIFKHHEGRFVDVTDVSGLSQRTGWWTSLLAHDLDGDGDVDLVAGNLGLNSTLRASPERPVTLYLKDFDNDGATDPVITYWRSGRRHLFGTVDEILQQFKAFYQRFDSYASFGDLYYEELFDEAQREGALVFETNTFESVIVENTGDGAFTMHSLPVEAQFGPIRAIYAGDFNRDGTPDLLLTGGFDGVPPKRGRYDAGYGSVLIGKGKLAFEPLPPAASGLYLTGDIRHISPLSLSDGRRTVLLALNNAGPVIVDLPAIHEE